MALPRHEPAALGTALCWATTGVIAADAVRVLRPFHFNLIRQVFVTLLLAVTVTATHARVGHTATTALGLAISGIVGILIGDTINFAAVGRPGPRRAGAIFALNAPMAALPGWLVLDEAVRLHAILGICVTCAGVAGAILGRRRAEAHRIETVQGVLSKGLLFFLGAALGQATGSLIARPIMTLAWTLTSPRSSGSGRPVWQWVSLPPPLSGRRASKRSAATP